MLRENTMTLCQEQRNPLLCSTMRTMAAYLPVVVVGILFGIVLTKSEVISWYRVHSMFRFQEAHMYLVIISAIVTGAISLWIIRTFKLKTMQGEPVVIKTKPYQKGMIYGGVIFGLGWAITGACPGPVYAQLGSGEWLALLSFAGALTGSYLYAYLRAYLPH